MKVVISESEFIHRINEDGDDSLATKAVKAAYGAVKSKLVALLTGNQILDSIGTVIKIMSFLPGVDGKAVENKMKELTSFMQGGIKNIDQLLEKVPLLETLFGEEK